MIVRCMMHDYSHIKTFGKLVGDLVFWEERYDVIKRWNAYMSDILEIDIDPELGTEAELKPVFRLD